MNSQPHELEAQTVRCWPYRVPRDCPPEEDLRLGENWEAPGVPSGEPRSQEEGMPTPGTGNPLAQKAL